MPSWRISSVSAWPTSKGYPPTQIPHTTPLPCTTTIPLQGQGVRAPQLGPSWPPGASFCHRLTAPQRLEGGVAVSRRPYLTVSLVSNQPNTIFTNSLTRTNFVIKQREDTLEVALLCHFSSKHATLHMVYWGLTTSTFHAFSFRG